MLLISIFLVFFYSQMMASIFSNLSSHVSILDVDKMNVSICVIVVHIFISFVWISCLPELVWWERTLLFDFPLLYWSRSSVILVYFSCWIMLFSLSLCLGQPLCLKCTCCRKNRAKPWFLVLCQMFSLFLAHLYLKFNQGFLISQDPLNSFKCLSAICKHFFSYKMFQVSIYSFEFELCKSL